VLTLGIDLASQPGTTAACLLRWEADRCSPEFFSCGLNDARLEELLEAADFAGIDASFCWPREYLEFAAAQLGRKPSGDSAWTPDRVRRLRLRATDRWIDSLRQSGQLKLRHSPLSVSTDKLSLPAMRCAGLLERTYTARELNACRRLEGSTYEVYPAASLAHWMGACPSYKGAKHRPALRALSAHLLELAPWIELQATDIQNDHLLDGLIAALTARAAGNGGIQPIPQGDQHLCAIEGWIAMPAGPLASLVDQGGDRATPPTA
jgi:predicted nuclease with RNAse H fold